MGFSYSFKRYFDTSLTRCFLPKLCAGNARSVLLFAAYGIVSVPAGKLVKKIGYQKGIVIGLGIAAFGCLLFYPAAAFEYYPFFLGALFILASGITILQVSANPYVTALGNPNTSSSRLTMTQAFYSLGTTIAPFFLAYLIAST